MEEIGQGKAVAVLHAVIGVIIGWGSFLVKGIEAGVLGIVVLIILAVATKKITKKGLKVWAGSAIIYLFVWFASWIYFLNVFV